MSVVLAVPDIHSPFGHQDYLSFLQSVKRKFRPTEIVCLGDEVDFHAISDYEHDPDGLSAGDELRSAIASLRPLYKLFPNVSVCTSNHTSRPFRQAKKHGLPVSLFKDYRDFLEAPKGWEWADSWEIDHVIYEHGEPYTGAQAALKCALDNSQSTVIGHVHSHAGIQWAANPKHLLFGFNVGCLIDRKKYAFAYGKKQKSKPVLGCGIIVDGLIPTFVPMLLDRSGRWTGKL